MADFLQENPSKKFIITPLLFLDLCKTFVELMIMKKRENIELFNKYEKGLLKIDETSTEVAKLQQELEIMSPELDKSIKVIHIFKF